MYAPILGSSAFATEPGSPWCIPQNEFGLMSSAPETQGGGGLSDEEFLLIPFAVSIRLFGLFS